MTLASVLSIVAAAGTAYLAGSIPFGLIVGRLARGVDIREHGSGNLGATNAMRVLGRGLGGAVFALDFAKGFAPAFAAPHVAAAVGEGEVGTAWAPLAAGLGAVLGHVFPIYLKFRGGKGVATSAGVFAALAPIATLAAFAVFAATVLATRFVSLGSVLAALALPAALVLTEGGALRERLPVTAAAAAVALVVVVRHRGNLARLLAGTERRLGTPKTPVGP